MQNAKKVINISIIVLIISLFSSCSSYQKLLKSEDDALKYEKAISYYNDGNYYKALQLFDQLVTVYRGTSKAEKFIIIMLTVIISKKIMFLQIIILIDMLKIILKVL